VGPGAGPPAAAGPPSRLSASAGTGPRPAVPASPPGVQCQLVQPSRRDFDSFAVQTVEV